MLYKFCAALTAVCTLFITISGACFAGEVDATSIYLARCEGVYLYGGQAAQMNNNEGLAKNILLRASRTSVALFMLNDDNGNVAASKLSAFSHLHSEMKAKLDNRSLDLLDALNECDIRALPVVVDVEQTREKLWGLSFQELQNQVFQKYLSTLGIN